MSDLMTFPYSVEEFMERYKIVDTDGIYMSKGAELVPIFRMRQWFEHLPSAQPNLQPTCNQLATDCISRQAAIDALADYIHNVDRVVGTGHLSADDCKDAAISVLADLPSAQRTGRWIDDEMLCKARCSVCDEKWSWMDNDMDRFLFCPHCGARMEEGE